MMIRTGPWAEAASRPEDAHSLKQQIDFLRRQLAVVREREARLTHVVENTPAVVAYVDEGWRFRLVNVRYEAVFGQKREHLLGRTMGDVFCRDDDNALSRAVARGLSGEYVRIENRSEDRTGRAVFEEVTIVPDRDIDGLVRGCTVIVVDITSRMEAEMRAAEALEDRTRAMSELAELKRPALPPPGQRGRLRSGLARLFGLI
ncbi:MAG: PAS domain S-box protein [Geminicoccaceae bacterium]